MTVSPVNYHSWRRFWARMFDYFLIGFLFLLLSRNSIFALNNIFLYSALQLIVVISAEAFMLARTGTTAGKSFLGLRVVSPSAPLDFNLAWKRTFWAYVKGLWLGIPIMMFVPAWFALALDLAPRVRVNCICPGDVATPMLGKQLQQADGSYTLEDVEQAYPLERVGEPLEIAHVICSVLSPFNSFMTGSIIPVDGGLTAK